MTFQFKPILTICVLISLVILGSLGAWQLRRLAWKEDLIAQVETRTNAAAIPYEEALAKWEAGESLEYTPVTISGVYDHENEAHVFGTWDGKIGWFIFTPLNVGAEEVVYINRGFVPEAQKEKSARLESVQGEAARVTITGLLRTPQEQPKIASALAPEDALAKNQWHQRNPQAFAEAASLKAQPIWIDSSGDENPSALPLGGVTKIEFNNRHFEYALTWFGLGGALLVVFFAFSVRRRSA